MPHKELGPPRGTCLVALDLIEEGEGRGVVVLEVDLGLALRDVEGRVLVETGVLRRREEREPDTITQRFRPM